MGRLGRWAYILLLAAAIFGAAWALKRLPTDTRPLIEEKYAGWSGVLRVWVDESASAAVGWLNRCGARFEKRHSGVYVQVIPVDGALDDLSGDGARPPELAVFGSAARVDEARLAAPAELPLREDFRAIADGHAAPIAVSGYLWAINRNLIEGISEDMTGAAVALPMDEPGRCFRRALAALASGVAAEQSEISLPGLDLGLDGPSATEAPAETVPCRLPEDLAPSDDAFERFLSGEVAAIPVSHEELARLQRLSDAGRGPDWTAQCTGARAFTDRVLLCGAVRSGDEREALAMAFISLLLEDESQSDLGSCGYLPVTDAAAGIKPNNPLAKLDAWLRTVPLEICLYK